MIGKDENEEKDGVNGSESEKSSREGMESQGQEKAKTLTKDLTEGKPSTLILGFAIPMLMGVLFQQFYSLVDTMIVGQLLGTQALAEVGSTGSIFFMVIGFVVGVCNGFAIPVAQRMGAGQHSMMRKYVAHGAMLSGIFALALTLLTTILCRNILTWMKTPEDIFQGAYDYIFIIFLGIPTTFLYNLVSCVIRSLGDSRTPVKFLALSSVINISLDYILIAYTPLGVAGAGWATVISQGISGVACLFYMKKKFPILAITKEECQWDVQAAKTLCYMGLPMGLQYSITAIGNVILQSAINGLGSVAVGAITAGQKVSFVFWSPFEALGGTMATYCGQNVGAMKLHRLKEGIRSACVMGSIYGILAYAVIAVAGEPMLMLFVNGDEGDLTHFMALAKEYLMIVNAFLVPLCFLNVLRFSIQGMGFSQFAMCAGVMEMFARILVATYFVPRFGFTAACYGSPVAWIAALFFLIPATGHCIKKVQKNSSIEGEKVET